jgi:hypothetical protein
MRRIIVEAKKYPVRLKNNAEERRPVVVVRLAPSGKLRKHFAEVIEVVPEPLGAGQAECGFDLLSDFVGVVSEACSVDNAAHMRWLGKLRGRVSMRDTLVEYSFPDVRFAPDSDHGADMPACLKCAKPGNREKSNLPGKSCSIEAIQKVLHVFVANKNRIFATIHTCNKTWREAVEHRDFGLGTRYVASPSAACNH